MKRVLFSIIITVFCLLANAQVVEKRDKLFGGSFYINYNSTVQQNSGGIAGLTPSFAWAIGHNIVLGLKGTISYSKSTTTAGQQVSEGSWLTIGPGIFLKKYKPLKDRFGVFFNNEINVVYTIRKEHYPFGSATKTDNLGVAYAFNPGVFYKFSDIFLLDAAIGGVFANYYSGSGLKSFAIGASFLQSFNIGINYIIKARRSS